MLWLAADDNPVNFQWLPFITSIVVFSLAFIILSVKVWPRILEGLEARDKKIRDEIAAAEQARDDAKSAQAEYESSLQTARQEAAAMISKAKSDAKTVADDLRARNETELNDMKQRAYREIESAKHGAITELHAEATTLAAAMAGKILQREISVDDQKRLVEESLAELGQARG